MSPSSPWRRIAYVYAGSGTSARCVAAMERSLRLIAPRFSLLCRRIDAVDLARPHWAKRAALLCIPGGRDLPYTRDLRGPALARIRSFVAAGGLYVGSCAGAYFACHQLTFYAARVPAIAGQRKLRMLAAEAWGPSQGAASFDYAEGEQAGERQLTLMPTSHWRERVLRRWQVFNQGGCILTPIGPRRWRQHERVLFRAAAESPELAPLAHGAAVVVLATYGQGRTLLLGAHPELTDGLKPAFGTEASLSGERAMGQLLAYALERVPRRSRKKPLPL